MIDGPYGLAVFDSFGSITKLQNKWKNWKKANKKKQELNSGGAADQLHGGGAANQVNYGGLTNPMPGPDFFFQKKELQRASSSAEWKRWHESGLIGGPLLRRRVWGDLLNLYVWSDLLNPRDSNPL